MINSYKYVALNYKGEEVTGLIEANNEGCAIRTLRDKGLYPTQVSKCGEKKNTTIKPAFKKKEEKKEQYKKLTLWERITGKVKIN